MSESERTFLFDKRKVRHRMRPLFSLPTDSGIDGVGTCLQAGRATNLGGLRSVFLHEWVPRTQLGSGPRAMAEDGTETFPIGRSRQDTVSASVPLRSRPQVKDMLWPRGSFDYVGVGFRRDTRVIEPLDLQGRAK